MAHRDTQFSALRSSIIPRGITGVKGSLWTRQRQTVISSSSSRTAAGVVSLSFLLRLVIVLFCLLCRSRIFKDKNGESG